MVGQFYNIVFQFVRFDCDLLWQINQIYCCEFIFCLFFVVIIECFKVQCGKVFVECFRGCVCFVVVLFKVDDVDMEWGYVFGLDDVFVVM